MQKFFPHAAAVLLAASAVGAGYAQSAVDGAIGGTLRDSSGSAVPNAQIVVRSNDTNAEQTLTTDDQGFFRVIHLQPGDYTVTATAAGFSNFSAPKVVVTVGSLTNIEPKLGLSGAAEVVDVTSDAPAINTTNNDFSNTIDLHVLEDLPVNNYRWSAYALLTPGVVADSSGFGLLSFRGQSTLLNNIQFDGEDDNQAFFSEERGRTRVGYSTAKASIQEFQVNTSNYSVEYGRSAGGVVNAVTRSGTNTLHGEAYFFDRDAEWGTINPFTTRAVQTTPGGPFTSVSFKPKDWRKQMGVGVGGPIIKNKVFFFFAFDRFLRNFPGISAPSSPGQFYLNPSSTPPNSSCSNTSPAGVAATANSPAIPATVEGAVCALAANLNGIRPTINPATGSTTATAVSKVTLAQYAAALPVYTSGIAALNGITGLTPRVGDQYIYFPKIDWQINGKNHATFEVNRLRWTSPAGIQTSSSALGYGVASFGNDYVKSTFGIAKLDTSITPTISNELRYQYGRDFEYEFNQTPTAYENSTLLNPTSGPTPGYVNPFGIPPNVSISNAFQFGTATFLNRPAYPDERRWEISDTVNKVRGNHNFKFGFEYLHTNDLSENLTSVFGAYTYSGANFAPYQEYLADAAVANGCSTTVQNSTTRLYSVVPVECYTGYGQGFGPLGFEFQTGDWAGFIQDEWKVAPRLSLTLGLRYEYEQLPKPQIPNQVTPQFARGSTGVFPDNRTNIGPRVGFAIDVFGNGKTSIRGGYGEFFARLINSTIYNAIAQSGNPAGQTTISLTNSLGSNGLAGPIFPQILPTTTNTSGVGSVYYFDRNFKLPEVHQADLTVEQDLGYKTTLGITWLSAFGRRLPDFVDTNLPASSTTVTYVVQAPTAPGVRSAVAPGTVIRAPYYTGPRPNTAYGSTTDIFSGVNSNYEALVAKLDHRLTNNLTFSVNYTWSHALDYGENNTTFTNSNSVLDPNNLRLEYGNSNQNVPNRFIAYAIYNTPDAFHGFLGYLLNNYEVSPSFSGQNGLPYSAGLTGNFNNVVLDNGTRVATTGAITPASTGAGFNGTNGTARVPGTDRNIFQYRRALLLDLRLSKRFKVAEKYNIELLGESFNIANHLNQTGVGSTSAYGYTAGAVTGGVVTTPNFLTPNASFGSFNPATINVNGVPASSGSANGNFIYTPRQVQLGVRVQF